MTTFSRGREKSGGRKIESAEHGHRRKGFFAGGARHEQMEERSRGSEYGRDESNAKVDREREREKERNGKKVHTLMSSSEMISPCEFACSIYRFRSTSKNSKTR
jgi:hypothetical protein